MAGSSHLKRRNDPVLTRAILQACRGSISTPIHLSSCIPPNIRSCFMSTITPCAAFIPDGRPNSNRPGSPLDGNLGRPLGGGHHLRCGYGRIQRQDLARSPGSPAQRSIARVERFRRVNQDHLELDITMQDPKALAKPWDDNIFLRAEAKVGAGGNLLLGRLSGLSNFEK